MNDKLKIITGLIAELSAERVQTPHLHVAIGGLQTALENLPHHQAAIERIAAQKTTASTTQTTS